MAGRALPRAPVAARRRGGPLHSAGGRHAAADELVLLAVDDRQVVVGQLAPLLLHLAGDLLPVAFERSQFVGSFPLKVSALIRSARATARASSGCCYPSKTRGWPSVRLLRDHPPALFREARAVSAFQLDPALLSSIDNRGGRRAGDGRQHLPLPRSPISSLVDRPSDVPGEVACGLANSGSHGPESMVAEARAFHGDFMMNDNEATSRSRSRTWRR
jgi:hypothetical protein